MVRKYLDITNFQPCYKIHSGLPAGGDRWGGEADVYVIGVWKSGGKSFGISVAYLASRSDYD